MKNIKSKVYKMIDPVVFDGISQNNENFQNSFESFQSFQFYGQGETESNENESNNLRIENQIIIIKEKTIQIKILMKSI